ncbi:winged helix-turn-helix domain-containing protein [Rhodobacter sp. HX-7-19]|uniref:Winged helix-turn-helix domain-containing protein n=1 Tax=Paragemmobacter kunshanensis TaxID=2583234 RepID=A0A6M1TYA0_9RHOB|nr:crosslink repair DNA glycosylase YcaQ family protein [Rhodobacter kunshanensis]NGQ90204.1 winged helix-turn-helix domain-containing protein [Rhodobacter kunshanensis]
MSLKLIPNSAARRHFLDRHALAEPPLGACAGPALAGLVARIGFVQVDSITTVARAHDMILWARRGGYRPSALKRALEGERALWEHWTHDASILPVGLWPMWRARFAADEARLHGNWQRWFRDGYQAQFGTILDRIARDGPVSSSDVGEGEARGKGGWWDWHPSKTALEWLWRTGRIAVTRRDGFRKVYDLTERVIPDAVRAVEVAPEAVVDWACGSALERLGFGTAREVAAYWNAVSGEVARDWLARALRDGWVEEALVEGADGTRRRVFTVPGLAGAEVPEVTGRLRVLSPFDPALRDRARAEFLFGFRYRIEVFVPEPKRVFGYYVFPLLEGERLVGRIDVKRAGEVLAVRAVWPEPGVNWGRGRQAKLEAELGRLAGFVGSERVEWAEGWLRAYPQGWGS